VKAHEVNIIAAMIAGFILLAIGVLAAGAR